KTMRRPRKLRNASHALVAHASQQESQDDASYDATGPLGTRGIVQTSASASRSTISKPSSATRSPSSSTVLAGGASMNGTEPYGPRMHEMPPSTKTVSPVT